MLKTSVLLLALSLSATGQTSRPIIDNERVTVWDLNWTKESPGPLPPHQRDFLTVCLVATTEGSRRKGDVVLAQGGISRLNPGERTVVIEFKDHPVKPVPNNTGYPLAFPRPHVKKLLENDRILVWSYAWTPAEPTPMHFHDKDVVVIYMEDTALKSTAPDGKITGNEYSAFQIKFNPRDRSHTEMLAKGTGSAIMTELK